MEKNNEPRNKPTHIWQTNIDKGVRNMIWKDNLFNKLFWENWISTTKQ